MNNSELQDTLSRPANMRALHSSSALAVNFFDSWHYSFLGLNITEGLNLSE